MSLTLSSNALHDHVEKTKKLAQALSPRDIYYWLVTTGYFPEPYVLPPCFAVVRWPDYGTRYWDPPQSPQPRVTQLLSMQFPKSRWVDRRFSIIDPQLHSDIALTIAENWSAILGCLFAEGNSVASYSFPIPVASSQAGQLGRLRVGRMIYEFIELTERDLVSEAYRFDYLLRTDVSAFFPSIYTHSIAWSIHGREVIRRGSNRRDLGLFGNRLDRLFQYANDQCTNGVPIGPVVSDIVAELMLSSVDRKLSEFLSPEQAVVARFRDDYRVLARDKETGQKILKRLQKLLEELNLTLSENKTSVFELPEGLFRPWRPLYSAANPDPRLPYSFKRFRELYQVVLQLNRDHPGCGVVDSFLADLCKGRVGNRLTLRANEILKVVSLLLMLADLRAKSFPMALAVIESVIRGGVSRSVHSQVEAVFARLLDTLRKDQERNAHTLAWLVYFIRTNELSVDLGKPEEYNDQVVRAVRSSRLAFFDKCTDFKIMRGVRETGSQGTLLKYLGGVFQPSDLVVVPAVE